MKLDRRIMIQAPAQTRGSAGGIVPAFSDVREVWAEKVSTTSAEFVTAQALRAEVTTIFKIRWFEGLTTKYRVQFEGRFFKLLGVDEPDRRATMILQAVETEGLG